MAVVLTLVQTKQIRINIHERKNTNTVNTSTRITYKNAHTKTNQKKQQRTTKSDLLTAQSL